MAEFKGVFKAIFLFLGIGLFLLLAYALPIWHDEAFSIWASKTPLWEILSGRTDPVHPPGYYLFLKLWSFPSDHLFWLRMSSLFFFLVSFYLLDKIGAKIKGPVFSLCLLFLYLFSGYFVIFNWQVRMYAGVTALILASLFFLLNGNLLFFTLINLIGLYFDYGFFWYFIPLFFFLIFQAMIKKGARHREYFLSALISGALFLFWLPFFLENYQAGIGGIGWMEGHLSLLLAIPYFLGAHQEIFALPLILTTAFGFYLFWQKNRKKIAFQIILFSAAFSFISSWLFSLFFFPLFHLRSLQIVGLAVVFLSALTIDWLYQKRQYYLVFFVFLLVLMNFFFTFSFFFSKESNQLLLSFFPWKDLKTKIEAGNFDEVVFQKTKKLPTELLFWGLKYTLEGRESLPMRPIPYRDISSAPPETTRECELISESLLAIYGCRRDLAK